MNDFLSLLVAKQLGFAAVLRPRLASRYEPRSPAAGDWPAEPPSPDEAGPAAPDTVEITSAAESSPPRQSPRTPVLVTPAPLVAVQPSLEEPASAAAFGASAPGRARPVPARGSPVIPGPAPEQTPEQPQGQPGPGGEAGRDLPRPEVSPAALLRPGAALPARGAPAVALGSGRREPTAGRKGRPLESPSAPEPGAESPPARTAAPPDLVLERAAPETVHPHRPLPAGREDKPGPAPTSARSSAAPEPHPEQRGPEGATTPAASPPEPTVTLQVTPPGVIPAPPPGPLVVDRLRVEPGPARAAPASGPHIRVTIGRIEVRAAPTAPAPPPRAAPEKDSRHLSLDDYLKRRVPG